MKKFWQCLLSFILFSTPLFAKAGCWSDSNLIALSSQIASNGFPNTSRNLPSIFVCESHDFAPNIGGTYNSGLHEIRVPVWQLNSQNLNAAIAHELAHAENSLLGGNLTEFNGHNRGFMQALVSAGWIAEALRVAQYEPGANLALAEVRGGASSKPTYTSVYCEDAPPQIYRKNLPNGGYTTTTTIQHICREI